MIGRTCFEVTSPAPLCVGTGLIALDVLVNGKSEDVLQAWAGGSCGNVLIILAYLGWLSYPIARLGKDNPAEIILHDMRRWGVRVDFLQKSRENITPIIIERLSNGGRVARHEFRFKCPICGSHLPRSRPFPVRLINEIMPNVPAAQVYYFDRVSITAVRLAKEQRSRGALIVFEPCRRSKEKLFEESLRVAHVVKYSREQLDVCELEGNIPLEIMTLGAKGLRYRLRNSTKQPEWRELEAFHVSEVVDSAGAGDWCTAGIIHMLGQHGPGYFTETNAELVENALVFGEALAALKCSYEGARGLMYNLEKETLQSLASKLVEGKNPYEHISSVQHVSNAHTLRYICPSCNRMADKS